MDRREFIKLAGSILIGLIVAPAALVKKVSVEVVKPPLKPLEFGGGYIVSDLDRVGVRRMTLYIKKELERSMADRITADLDAEVMAGLEKEFTGKLSQIKMRMGSRPFDYRVVCDETNNTPKTMKRHELIADVEHAGVDKGREMGTRLRSAQDEGQVEPARAVPA